jgi:hypothetical protein
MLKACGKHVVRISSIVLLLLGYIIMITMSCFHLPDIYVIVLISIYSFGLIINFTGVLLPVCCKKLYYEYKSSNNIINMSISSDFKNLKNDKPPDEQIYPSKDDVMGPINDNEIEKPYYDNTNQGYDNYNGNNNDVFGNEDYIQYPSSQ